MPKKDLNEIAFSVARQAIGEEVAPVPTKAQEAGRQGGLKGGKSRAVKLTPEQRTDIAKKAAAERWKK